MKFLSEIIANWVIRAPTIRKCCWVSENFFLNLKEYEISMKPKDKKGESTAVWVTIEETMILIKEVMVEKFQRKNRKESREFGVVKMSRFNNPFLCFVTIIFHFLLTILWIYVATENFATFEVQLNSPTNFSGLTPQYI